MKEKCYKYSEGKHRLNHIYYAVRPNYIEKLKKNFVPYMFSFPIIKIHSSESSYYNEIIWSFKDMDESLCNYTYDVLREADIELLEAALIPLKDVYWSRGVSKYRFIPKMDKIKYIRYYQDYYLDRLVDWNFIIERNKYFKFNILGTVVGELVC